MTYLVLFGEVRSLLWTSDFAARQDQIHPFINYSCLYFRAWKLKFVTRCTAKDCVFGDLNFPFFPPLRTFWWNLDVYVLGDICKYMCG